ncbi:GNAT family N-acetyltransferase [Nocardia sp. CNY236]|uniref:GNAT family N-acetyltransferase n=1 Tax=Nocardia sp. CNY236 TaxID=1169152 RepID=UPI0003FE5552|nr:GNAT family N-acetyltransferase [Nocardia sp. CNY236]
MTTRYTFTALTNADPEFYPIIGPYLANRAVTKQLGDTPHDDPGKTWIIAHHRNTVAGFIVHFARKDGTVHAESCYVAPEHDDLRRKLVQAVIDAVDDGATITTVARKEYVHHYTDLGFIALPSRYKNFRKLRRPPTGQ